MVKPTGILLFPAFDWAISPTHPEREERLLYTRDQLFEEGIMDMPEIKQYTPRLASEKDIVRAHFMIPTVRDQITEPHFISSGSTLVIADAFMRQEIKNGFAVIRPPGHHAMTVSHGNRGFCNINNEAIMVEYLRQKYKLKRIAIVDTDVHHGDGTQEIYYDDPDVLFISFHQDGRTLYPGSGHLQELGGPLAHGATINIPLPPGTTDQGFLYVLDNLVLPLLEEFKPDIVINSAGQDNHYTDPLANMRFTAQGYARLNQRLAPDIAVLEGGYSVETALPYVNMGIIMAMAGIDFSFLKEPDYRPADFREQESNMKYIVSLVENQLRAFRGREQVVEQNRRTLGDYYYRQDQIFYDTDYIYEDQRVGLRICPICPGFKTIKSSAKQPNGKYYDVMCISVFANCCAACHQEAINGYKSMKESNFDYIYLQDRIKDEYRVIDRKMEQEMVI